jgi:hypothetical protein
MGAADVMLFLLLALADACLLIHLHRRRQRRVRAQRMMKSLRRAIQREVGVTAVTVPATAALVLQRAG